MFGEQIHLFETFGNGEAARAVANNHDVIGTLHHGFREPRDILDAPHGGDGARAARGPMHNAGVEFDFAFFVGQAAVADGVVVGIVFDHGDGGNDGIKRVATFFENVHAAAKRVHSVGAGDNDRALALRGRRDSALAIRHGGGQRRPFEQIGYAGSSAARQRGKKEFTA